MKTHGKFLLIFASCMVILGSILFVVAMSINGWDFTKLNIRNFQTNVHEITSDFNSIQLETDTADINFKLSSDGKCKVVCYEEEKTNHLVTVKDGILKITEQNQKEWYDYLGLNFGNSKVTVYLPQSSFDSLILNADTSDVVIDKELSFLNLDIRLSTGDAKIYSNVTNTAKIVSSTGDITIQNNSIGALDLSLTTGDVDIMNVTCQGEIKIKITTGDVDLMNVTCSKLTTTGDTGDLEMTNVIATQSFNIERDTGEVNFERCDAGEIYIETDTGDVKGSLLTPKIFMITTDTGDVRVPSTTSGGICKIITDTGDVKVTIN